MIRIQSIIEHTPPTAMVVALLAALALGSWVAVPRRPRTWLVWSAAVVLLAATQLWNWLGLAFLWPAEVGIRLMAIRHLVIVVVVGVLAAVIPWVRIRAGHSKAN